MAARKAPRRSDAGNSSNTSDSVVEELRRISKLLALLAIKGESQEEKILTLMAAGFAASEVSDLLRTTSNVVFVTVHRSKKKPKKKKTTPKRGKSR